ncbi:MAG: T9SS type A sorting domain-containing protein [candidate division Zixibacteria bacterium]|nr:T9SS type A sorting domain-containing protein [candidate division Zixibacteria bacterium]
MRKVSILVLMFIMLAWISAGLSYSRSQLPEKGSSGDKFAVLPNVQNRAHTANNLWLCISNWGVLGSMMRDPSIGGLPSSAFPGGSDLEYLFQGGIWIGAVVNDTPYVSLACDGWFWIYELWPDSGMTGAIVENEWWGDQEFIAVYADTATGDPWAPWPDPWGPHHPLDIRITQHSYSWQCAGYNDFVILDYTIENIGTQLLTELYIGFYIDADIQHIDEDGYGTYGAQDDITGFLGMYEGDTVNIAWMADNDGHGEEDGGENATVFTPGKSPTGVVGMKVLDTPNPDLQISYNWWISHMMGLPRDWGPWKAASQPIWEAMNPYGSGNLFPGNVLGTPGGDVSKYFIMSNQEFDYDQIYSCVWPDWYPDEGWLPANLTMCDNLANGFDTRFLLSFGPFDTLAPGDSFHFAVAWVAGDSFHVDPTNLAQDPQMTDPDRFYSNLNFSKLVENSETALLVYQSGYTLPPPGPPKNLRLSTTTDSTVELSWSPKTYHSLLGYNLYRSTVPGEHNDPPINSSVITDTVFQDTGLHATEVYYYAISSVNTSYVEGCLSSDLEVTVGRPSIPTGLSAEAEKNVVTLFWQHNSEDDVIGYNIYRTEDCSTYVLVDSVGWQDIYSDHTVDNGIIYYYRITAVDSTELESFSSDTVYALPMAFDQGILVLDQTNAQTNPWDYQYGDSVDSFYNRALQSYEFAFIHHDSCHGSTDRVSLPELSPYEVCILHCEELLPFCHLFDDSCETILKHYLRAGGKLIIEGREALFIGLGIRGARGWHDLGPHWWCDFAYNWLRMDSAYFSCFAPPYPERNEFVGARSEVPEYPDLDVDTSRVNSSIDPAEMQLNGKLPGIGCVIPQDWQETIYTFNSAYSDYSPLQGMPVAIRHLGADHQVIFFCFPLYFIQEDQATQLLHQALADLGVPFTDVPDKEKDQENIPACFSLKQNYPNPFNPQTIIEYELAKDCEVEITVYNILGRKVRTLVKEFQKSGQQRVKWDGKDEEGKEVSSGIYFYQIKTPEFSQSKKMVLLR